MIPEAAVEAAADVFARYVGIRDTYAVAAILEAAAPHMLAEAWEAGWQASSDWSIYIDMGGDEPTCDNPYKGAE